MPSGSATRSYNGNFSKNCIRRYRPNAPMKARTTTLRYMIALDSNQLRQVLPGSPALKLFTVAAKRDSHTLATTDVVIPEVIRQCGVLLAAVQGEGMAAPGGTVRRTRPGPNFGHCQVVYESG